MCCCREMLGERRLWSVPNPLSTGVITVWPRCSSIGVRRSHVPVDCHAPWTRTNVDMRAILTVASSSVYVFSSDWRRDVLRRRIEGDQCGAGCWQIKRYASILRLVCLFPSRGPVAVGTDRGTAEGDVRCVVNAWSMEAKCCRALDWLPGVQCEANAAVLILVEDRSFQAAVI